MIRNWLCPGLGQGSHKVCAGNWRELSGKLVLALVSLPYFSSVMSSRGKLTIREFFQPIQAFQNPAPAKKRKGKFSLSVLIQEKSGIFSRRYRERQIN